MRREELTMEARSVQPEAGSRDRTAAEGISIGLQELEERLEAELLQTQGLGPFGCPLCIWYTCPDVCPPGG
ncbi:MAG: hypothetical protein AB1640_04185 [bacterium]